jgi:phosphoribosyl 1,2-cyclic phosphate phosphodiesterase
MAEFDIHILGCGGSGGVPLIGNYWGNCDPNDPRDNRTRSSIFLRCGNTQIVVDTGPDFRQQMNRLTTAHSWDGILSAIILTHSHADHIFGIDDTRAIQFRMQGARIPLYTTQEDIIFLKNKHLGYLFESDDVRYPPRLDPQPIVWFQPFQIDNIPILPIRQEHGYGFSTGLRIGDFAYCTDVSALSEQAFEALQGVKTWIIGVDDHAKETHSQASQHVPIEIALEWQERLGVEQVYFTHLNYKSSYQALVSRLPAHVRPCHDGLVLQGRF